MKQFKRKSGILLHPTSLPSPYGIGELGKSAYDFIDFLEKSGQHLWQVLPLTHTGFGDSPYQSFSSFAGQPLLISLEHLKKLGFLNEKDLSDCPVSDESNVDYGTIIPWKQRVLKKAYEVFFGGSIVHKDMKNDFYDFCAEAGFWLDDYALFLTIKDLHQGKSWQEWDEEYKQPTKKFKTELFLKYEKEIGYYQFLQYMFFTEWNAVKAYANEHGIEIIGDIPIFVSMDSADVWGNPSLFQLDTKGHPLAVAGVPPDYFSETGQLWGNPLYDWDAHEETKFAWWISRIKNQLKYVDILRIDHFRGFEAYWSVPYGEKTAINGKWVKAPGQKLFEAVQKALGKDLPIIAEDLGTITKEVDELRTNFEFPGMKILQFAFETTGESNYLPHQYPDMNCVCYTGTHDNDTTIGWYKTLKEDCKKKVLAYTRMADEKDVAKEFIRLCLASVAAYAIFPLQDVLEYGSEGRMNTPGVAAGNWSWRYPADALTDDIAEELKTLSILFGRHLPERPLEVPSECDGNDEPVTDIEKTEEMEEKEEVKETTKKEEYDV